MLYETACRSAMANEHVMSNYFPVAVGHAGHQWLVRLSANYFDSWQELKQAFIDNRATSTICNGSEIGKMSHCASTSGVSQRCASRGTMVTNPFIVIQGPRS